MLMAFLLTVLGAIALFAVVDYVLPLFFLAYVLPNQNLKKKYNAKWALVTGGSSGIGKALAEKMAEQGLNVVLAALPDNLLKETHADLTKKFPNVEFRAVGVDLGNAETKYMENLIEQTKDIDVQVVFNNAGYCIINNFFKNSLERQLSNMECNMTSHVKIAHHYMAQMVEKKLPGCVVFTGSQAAFFATPGAVMYSSTKAFLAQFAYCLAIEGKDYGIDVTCLQSGPMRTRFNDKLPKLSALKFFESIASSPEEVAQILINSVGRVVLRDASLYTILTRMLCKVIDNNTMFRIVFHGQKVSADYKNFKDLH
eukprot:TRINITY_DN10969_c0_g1_i1.p1 TRINITY_DN10969_c0_g1~~TRINITY_DN10969_c0_g1_i1.p1  ORF type:complete len:312 (-),score=126.26 TRINITY_DN10969_c0_g1_i1:64-999(-)